MHNQEVIDQARAEDRLMFIAQGRFDHRFVVSTKDNFYDKGDRYQTYACKHLAKGGIVLQVELPDDDRTDGDEWLEHFDSLLYPDATWDLKGSTIRKMVTSLDDW